MTDEERGEDADFVTLRAGQSVGRYRILAVLGQGGFGITYRAADSQLGRDIAIKEYLPTALAVRQDGTTVLPRSTSAARDFAWGRDRFVVEGRTLAALHQAPGIVRVHDFLEANGTAYLVMELISGESLEARLRRVGTLDAAAIDKILKPLLDGLERVHEAGFLHRDIKPANILIDAEGRPTLIDFGASRAAIAGRSQAMTAIFTPGYAAVEQMTSANQGPWTDIYGLAATLYHAMTGEPPPSSIDRALDDSYVPLASSNRAYPRALLAGVDAGLSVRAADRPQSIAEWRSMLLMSDSDSSQATIVVRPRSTQPAPQAMVQAAQPRPGRSGILAAGAALAAVGLAVGGYFLLMPASRPPVTAPPLPVQPSAQEQAAKQQEAEAQARLQREKEADELQRLRAEAEARRKADEEAALRKKIEDELRQKAEAEAAAKLEAEQKAKEQAEAEAAVKRKAEEQDKKSAEAAETALHLTQVDRQHLQIALTSLGYDTAGNDGVFGPRSRDMIMAWQRASNLAATGFLTADQQAMLLRTAAAAVARFDAAQKKLEDERNKPAGAAPAANEGSGSSLCNGRFRSQWCRGAWEGFPADCWYSTMTIKNGAISDAWGGKVNPELRQTVIGTIDGNGNVSVTYNGVGQQTYVNRHFTTRMSGRVSNGILTASGKAGTSGTGREFTLRVECR